MTQQEKTNPAPVPRVMGTAPVDNSVDSGEKP